MNLKDLLPKDMQESFPQVVDESGQEIVRPDVLQTITQLATLGQLAKIRKHLETEKFEGKFDPRTVEATEQARVLDLVGSYPYTPWINAFIINDGPDSAFLSFNEYHPHKINKGETLTVDQSHAEERLRLVFYGCEAGGTATLRIIGQY